MVSCVREKCIYQWKTLQNSLIISFVCLPGGGKNECRSGKQKLLCYFGRSVPTRYVEDKIYGLEHVEQYLKEDKAV